MRGYLALLLHCHLPYIRHPEHDDFLEEDWFYEAVAETYVPLLNVLQSLDAEGVPFRLSVSFSPSLCEMLANDLLRKRCVRYLNRQTEIAGRELARHKGTETEQVARMYLSHYKQVRHTYVHRYGCDILAGYRRLAERGRVELMASAATHALLPLLETQESRTAQVATGVANYSKHFGMQPRGFWLPECAYVPGVEDLLADRGIEYFFVDTHGLLLADPRPPYGVFAPLATPAGPYAFGRDVETSKQVWSSDEGYPGDPVYREFYRDMGFDADWDYVSRYAVAGGTRRYLGFKYHRITGDVPLSDKAPYDPGLAAERASAHAEDFVRRRVSQVATVGSATGLAPLIVAPYDGELFGHWWFEGVQFLASVLRKVAQCGELTCVTPGEYLQRNVRPDSRPLQPGRPATSTWGDKGYFEVWVNGSNDWIYPRLQHAEARMVEAADRFHDARGMLRQALNQCARQLMLAQASDWPFLMCTGTAKDYATWRFNDLMERFDGLHDQVRAGSVDPDLLADCEARDDIFPEMDHRVFAVSGGCRRG